MGNQPPTSSAAVGTMQPFPHEEDKNNLLDIDWNSGCHRDDVILTENEDVDEPPRIIPPDTQALKITTPTIVTDTAAAAAPPTTALSVDMLTSDDNETPPPTVSETNKKKKTEESAKQLEAELLWLIHHKSDCHGRILLCGLNTVYRVQYGNGIPYKQLGYEKLIDFLVTLEHVTVVTANGVGQPYICATPRNVVSADAGGAIKQQDKPVILHKNNPPDRDASTEDVSGQPVPLSTFRDNVHNTTDHNKSDTLIVTGDVDASAITQPHDSSSQQPVKHDKNTADGPAAMELLRLLGETYQPGGRPWPTKRKPLKRAILSLKLKQFPSIRSWLQRGIDPDIKESKRNKEFVRRVVVQFAHMNYLTETASGILIWNKEAVRNVVHEHVDPVSKEGAVSLEDAPSPTTLLTKEQHSDESPIVFVDTEEKLALTVKSSPFVAWIANEEEEEEEKGESIVAIDCEGVPEHLHLIQIATNHATFVFDAFKLGPRNVCEALRPLLVNPRVTKLFHDLHKDAWAIATLGGVQPLVGTLDTQLAVESLTGNLLTGFNRMLEEFGHQRHPLKHSMKNRMNNTSLFTQRPLSTDILKYAALDASLLLQVSASLLDSLKDTAVLIKRASDLRAQVSVYSGGLRRISFDVANHFAMASRELLAETRPQDVMTPAILEVSDDSGVLLGLLPDDMRRNLEDQTELLSDIVLDKGREPLAWIKGNRVHLGTENRIVNQEDIDSIVDGVGGFGSDNRAGLEKQLHRISAMRNRQQSIIGLTLRVGRHVSGNAAMISDLLFAYSGQSILFLGEPGSGKTTVVREVAKQLADHFNVCIVDTSNEIAGDGDVPHPCVGYARRMMVPSLDRQSAVMIECVQNHTPEVMIIDEIGRPTKVEAARTCKQRGVRLIASAHGDLRKMIRNPKLRGLVGGVETVTLGDVQAKAEAKKQNKSATGGLQKLKAQRAGPPTFDIIVELQRGAPHEWRIILDVGEAVDRVLEGELHKSQKRTRIPETGELSLELEMA